ncbi:dimer_Tnp_hAT domain-containing protein [Trichonephila clavipes]|uniref:Dimer_Tnp_hAT domain-containing protein n=1 Tax=Trichonephila clavipes TaxID=2585209 RepID=A0A8X6RIH2_TRICX|nr:dimer_Tnp_hAT domain-containing protein [Trichonephila clavipes]
MSDSSDHMEFSPTKFEQVSALEKFRDTFTGVSALHKSIHGMDGRSPSSRNSFKDLYLSSTQTMIRRKEEMVKLTAILQSTIVSIANASRTTIGPPLLKSRPTLQAQVSKIKKIRVPDRDTPPNDELKYCKDLEAVLTHANSSDINTLDLAIVAVLVLPNKKGSPIEILKFLSNLDFAPNLGIVLRTLLTVSIIMASGERSFSKLKLIKKFLHSITTEDRLNGLTTIAIEHELAEEINVK